MKRNTAILSAIIALALGCGGDDADKLTAQNDVVTTALEEPVVIDVLANDLNILGEVTVEMVQPAVAGQVEILDDGTLQYTPSPMYIGADDMKYRITDETGESSEARVWVDVGCDECMNGRNIRLQWSPNDPAEQVIGYRVYFGQSENADEMTMIDDMTADTPGFDYDAPKVAYDAWYDLQLELGDVACFRATAYNSAGESDFSKSVCKPLDDPDKRDYVFGL